MSINIHAVKNDLAEHHWVLLSTEYKNLKSPLFMRCPEGHEVELSYDEWRKHKRCEKCLAGDPFQLKKAGVPAKTEGALRVLALDAATHITGFALYDDNKLIHYGTYTSHKDDITERINDLKKWLIEALHKWQPDFVGVEHIQLQVRGPYNSVQQVEVYRKLANAQGVIFDTLFEEKMDCGLVYPTEWRAFCGVSGKKRDEQKKQAQAKVKSWYGLNCSEDEADAICIGKFFALNQRREKRMNHWGEDL